MMEGTVLMVGQDRISGKYVVLRHGEFTVSYCHLSRILVSKGETVRPRDAVGITGSTGRSTGEHLHLTCRRNGKNVDPAEIAPHMQAQRTECGSGRDFRLHKSHAGEVRGGVGGNVTGRVTCF